ncbi:MAG: hypothetical protein LBK06_08295 [Planctomycetaceae bacterium]|jgi:hypothetical protein|nr:hypothetical protein [Planctomycetaceae bacterium]
MKKTNFKTILTGLFTSVLLVGSFNGCSVPVEEQCAIHGCTKRAEIHYYPGSKTKADGTAIDYWRCSTHRCQCLSCANSGSSGFLKGRTRAEEKTCWDCQGLNKLFK